MLKVLMLRHGLDLKRGDLTKLQAQRGELATREAELAEAIEESQTDEEQSVVQTKIEEFDAERDALEEQIAALEAEIAQREAELHEAEAAQETGKPEPETETRNDNDNHERSETAMTITNRAIERMSMQEREAFVQRDDVKSYLAEVRAAIKEKRALTNVGLTIPEVMLGLLKESISEYSKLYNRVTVRRVNGTGRQLIMGAVPEAVWTECCANLNELTLTFNDLELDCYKVGGYFAVCNANLEDADIALASELIQALGQAIGMALDKAILFGGKTGYTKMPLGITTRLLQESQPANYPATARPWVDLHTSNVKTIANTVTGAALISALVIDGSAAVNKYTNSDMTWVMNKKTAMAILSNTIGVDAQGRIVAGMANTMPVIGGEIVTVESVPDNMIVAGYYDLYTMAERAGQQFASSEHVRFLQDQTVFKGTARYDGAPAIAEAFVFIGINSTTPANSGVSFEPDDANSVQAIALNTSTLAITGTASKQLIAITSPGSGAVTWASSASGKATVDNNGVVTGVTSGTTTITATCGGLTASCVVTVS